MGSMDIEKMTPLEIYKTIEACMARGDLFLPEEFVGKVPQVVWDVLEIEGERLEGETERMREDLRRDLEEYFLGTN